MFTHAGMRKAFVCAFVLAAATSVTFGWGDDFDDNWRDPQVWTATSGNGGVLRETDRRLEYTCSVLDASPSWSSFELIYQPPYGQAWAATVDVHLESGAITNALATWSYGIGLAIYNPADRSDSVWLGHAAYSGGAENWMLIISTDGVITNSYNVPTTVDDGRVRITWDGLLLSAYLDEGSGFGSYWRRVLVDDWHMVPSETFVLALEGRNIGCRLPTGYKVHLDDFELVPGPETLWTGATGDWFLPGNWSNGVPTSALDARVQNGGTAQLSSGAAEARTLFLGESGGSGRLEWTGGSLSAGEVRVGPQGRLDVHQDWTWRTQLQIDGGAVDLHGQTLTLDSGAALCLNAGEMTGWAENIAFRGLANVEQFGGSHRVESHLALGLDAGSNGTYGLWDGELAAGRLVLGLAGTGLFMQNGGRMTVQGMLTVGSGGEAAVIHGGSGMYFLTGGDLTVLGEQRIGESSMGTFEQMDGNSTTPRLYVGYGSPDGAPAASSGVYHLGGGRLAVSDGVFVGHWANGAPGVGHMYINGGHLETGALHVGTEMGGPGQFGPGHVNWNGGSLAAQSIHIGPGGTMEVSPSSGPNWVYTGSLHQHGGNLWVGGDGLVLDGGGSAEVTDGNCMPNSLWIGSTGAGSFTQTGGRVEVMSYLVLGSDHPDAHGEYHLVGDGNCVAGELYVGGEGTGLFRQTAGEVRTGHLCLGSEPNSAGTYELGGTGRLMLEWGGVSVGRLGRGEFRQTGGLAVMEALNFGQDWDFERPGGTGVYRLLGGELRLSMGVQMADGNGTLIVDGGKLICSAEPPDPDGPAPDVGFHFMGSKGNFIFDGKGARLRLGEAGTSMEVWGNNRFTQQSGTVLTDGLTILSWDRPEDANHPPTPSYTVHGGELRIGPSNPWVYENDLRIGPYGLFRQTGGKTVIRCGHLLVNSDWGPATCRIEGGEMQVLLGQPNPDMPEEKRGGFIQVGPFDWSEPDASALLVVSGGTLRAGQLRVAPLYDPSMDSIGRGCVRMEGGRIILSGQARWDWWYATANLIGGRLEGYGTVTSAEPLVFADWSELAPSGGVLTLDAKLASAQRDMAMALAPAGSCWLPIVIPAGAGLRTRGELTGALTNAGLLASYGGELMIRGDLVNTGTLANVPFSVLRVQAASLVHAGSIEVRSGGGVSFDAAITNHAGQKITLYGGDLVAPQITNAPGGTMTGTGAITADLVNQGTTDFFGAVQLFGSLTNEAGAHVGLRNGNLLVTGPTVNEGTIKVLNGQAYFEGGYDDHGVGKLHIDPALAVVHGPMRVGPGGAVTLDAGSKLQLLGDFIIESTLRQAFDLAEGTVQFHGQGTHKLEAAGHDYGPAAAGWIDNFAFGRLVVEAGARLTLVDLFDNALDGAGNDALYVGELVLAPGTWVDLGSSKLYYRNGGQIKLLHCGDFNLDGEVGHDDLLAMKASFGRATGCGWCEGDTNGDGAVDLLDYLFYKENYGWASPGGVPEPATLAMLALGGAAVMLRRRGR